MSCADTQDKGINNTINEISMKNDSYTKSIIVGKSPAEAFAAIKNFRGWWSEEIDGSTDILNETFFYHYKDIHLCKIKLIEVVPGKRLVYRVVDNEFNFVNDKTEWIGTNLTFDISAEGANTKVIFTHEGLVPSYECYEVCNDAWTGYIGKSLKHYIEKEKGNPNPKDEDGFNAEVAKKWGLR